MVSRMNGLRNDNARKSTTEKSQGKETQRKQKRSFYYSLQPGQSAFRESFVYRLFEPGEKSTILEEQSRGSKLKV